MRILALYPNVAGYNRIPTGLAIVMTVLSEAGHELDLFDATFLADSNHDNDTREKAGLVKPVQSGASYEGLSQTAMENLWQEKVRAFSPDAIIVTLVEDNYRFAHRLLRQAKAIAPAIVTIAGGATPSAAPETVIENPFIDYLIQGEGASVELCERLQRGLAPDDVRNLWYKRDGRPVSNPLRPFIDMDTLPIQELRWWDPRHLIKPYDGKVYRTGSFESSRGCPFRCTYCVNHTLQDTLRSAGRFFRRKSPANTVREIKRHIELYKLERVVFCDDNFLLMPPREFGAYAEEFTALWKADVGLPYWINTSADFIRPDTAAFLRESGCDGVGMGVEAGSEWFRRNVLRRTLSNDRLADAFHLLHDYDIRTTGNAMIGFPGEAEEDILDTARLMKWLQPKSMDASFVSPYIGTDIHRVAAKLGYIEVLDEPGFRGMATEISFRDRSTIRNPMIPADRLSELYLTFNDYATGARPLPERSEGGGEDNPAGAAVVDALKALHPLGGTPRPATARLADAEAKG